MTKNIQKVKVQLELVSPYIPLGKVPFAPVTPDHFLQLTLLPPKTRTSAEKWWLEDCVPFEMVPFHVTCWFKVAQIWRLTTLLPLLPLACLPDRSQRPQMQRATRFRNRQDDAFSDLDSRGQLHDEIKTNRSSNKNIFHNNKKSQQKSFSESFRNHWRNYVGIELVSQNSVQIWILQPNEHLQVQDSTQNKYFENIRTPTKNTKTPPVLLASTSEFLHLLVIRDTRLVIQIGIQWNENWDPRMQEMGIRKWKQTSTFFGVHQFIYVNIYIFYLLIRYPRHIVQVSFLASLLMLVWSPIQVVVAGSVFASLGGALSQVVVAKLLLGFLSVKVHRLRKGASLTTPLLPSIPNPKASSDYRCKSRLRYL